MPGMEAAFVDVGLDRRFHHNSDIVLLDADGCEQRYEISPPIQESLKDGQDIIVQVAKDAISSKGARLTTHLTLPSRNLVSCPQQPSGNFTALGRPRSENVCWNSCRKCSDRKIEWSRRFYCPHCCGRIEAEEFVEDVRFLKRLWDKVEQRIQRKDGVKAVYRDSPVHADGQRSYPAGG